jgi:hypothetical protein
MHSAIAPCHSGRTTAYIWLAPAVARPISSLRSDIRYMHTLLEITRATRVFRLTWARMNCVAPRCLSRPALVTSLNRAYTTSRLPTRPSLPLGRMVKWDVAYPSPFIRNALACRGVPLHTASHKEYDFTKFD